MIISVRVRPNSREDRIEKIGENEYIVHVSAPARDGKANVAVVKMLSKYFGASYKGIKIKNPTSRRKIIEIATE